MSHTQLDLLWERVCSSDDTSKWTVGHLQKAVDGARSTFEELLHRKRTAYGVMKVVYTFFVGKGFKRSGLSPLKLALNMLSRKNAKDVSELSAQIAYVVLLLFDRCQPNYFQLENSNSQTCPAFSTL